tara:strand:- start:2391 stop:2600 length:210 start_codon:yes stop_codon:yes gene_type:complete
MDKIQRSLKRDMKVMSLGLSRINKEILKLETNRSMNKATRKRLERLNAVKEQLEINPEKSATLLKDFNK